MDDPTDANPYPDDEKPEPDPGPGVPNDQLPDDDGGDNAN